MSVLALGFVIAYILTVTAILIYTWSSNSGTLLGRCIQPYRHCGRSKL